MTREPPIATMRGVPPPTLRERTKAATRASIEVAAERLFLLHGFDQVTLERVADECGVSVRTVLRYFPTKEGLALARTADAVEQFRHGLLTRSTDVLTYWREFNLNSAAELAVPPALLRSYLTMIHGNVALRSQMHALMIDVEDGLAAALADESGDDGLMPRLLAALLVAGNLAVRRDWVNSNQSFEADRFLAVIDTASVLFHDWLAEHGRHPSNAS